MFRANWQRHRSTATIISIPLPTTQCSGWPQKLDSREALMRLYAGYGDNIVLQPPPTTPPCARCS